jgi:hypothetical protein
MGVGFFVGSVAHEVGSADFLHAFFSTISYHLEPHEWGSRYPELMNQLYHGKLEAKYAHKVRSDLCEIRQELQAFGPEEVVWDIDNLSAQPPWGNDISSSISNLSQYFVTSNGKNLFNVLIECLDILEKTGGELTIESY